MLGDALRNDIDKYNSVGEQKFYRYLLCQAINKLIKIRDGEYKGISPEIEYLNYSERFLFLYRHEDDEAYLKLSSIFRKAAHKIYRFMLKRNMVARNSKFLNVV